jgi:hypothetical protein
LSGAFSGAYALSARLDQAGYIDVRALKLSSTIEADPVGPLLDREHSAHVAMMAAEGNAEDPKQRVHHG